MAVSDYIEASILVAVLVMYIAGSIVLTILSVLVYPEDVSLWFFALSMWGSSSVIFCLEWTIDIIRETVMPQWFKALFWVGVFAGLLALSMITHM